MFSKLLAIVTTTVLSVSLAAAAATDLRIGDLSVQPVTGSISKITGTAKNITPSSIDYANIVLNLYDQDNALVENTAVIASGIEPGGVWRFEAMATKPFSYVKVGDVKVTLKPAQ